ncbi:MAG: arylsulfatase [Chthonomonadales bacterium]
MGPLIRQLTRIVFACVGLIATSYCDVAAAQPDRSNASPPRPNVLLILADDLGFSDLGCMGGEISTPNLDAMAKSGLLLTQFYNSARCCPSRASLLTGVHPHQAGFPAMSGSLSDQAVTLPEVLKPAGYNCYMVGKWHLSERTGPVIRGFDEFYGMLGGFNSYWQEQPYFTRIPADHPRRAYRPGEFYSTDVFGDYSLDFIDQGQKAGKPWFLYLAFNAVHFPLHAPKATIEKYEKLYLAKGWDKIRKDRLVRQKKLGIVPKNLELTPRSVVPKNRINVQTGWADKYNPAWDSLPADRKADLARRMAVYAAAAEIMDRNIGRVVKHLKEMDQWENTVVFFLSDNGACAEWDPCGFDKLDSPLNILHAGDDLKKVGGPDSYISYGSGWANASSTPLRLYKHYAHEGGIRTPLIVHWSTGLKTKPGAISQQPGYITDIMSTLLDLCGATYPTEHNGHKIVPMEGVSLAPLIRNERTILRILCVEHEGNRMVRDGRWKLVAMAGDPWELYDLSSDPAESHDLSTLHPNRVKKLSREWNEWAERCNVIPKKALPTPQIANKDITVECDVAPLSPEGVILAQGSNQNGYALYLKGSKPIFAIRIEGKLFAISATNVPGSRFHLYAHLNSDRMMTLAIDGRTVAREVAPGLIPVQPIDPLSIGEDVQTAVGDYVAPNPLKGTIENVKIVVK